MRLLAYFREENPHRILIPRGRLFLFWLLLFSLESAVCLLWNGIFIILALFLVIPMVYLWCFGWRLWRTYYAAVWYVVCLLLLSGGAVGLCLLIRHLT